MKVRKTVKKIVALGVGATMVGATLLGAAAMDLGQFPKQFYDEDEGTWDGWFVAGDKADGADVIGLTSVLNAVKDMAMKKTWIPSGVGEVSVEGGVRLVEPGDALLLGDTLSTSKSFLDRNDLDMLKDGSIRIGSTTYTYTQELDIGNHQIVFNKDHSDLKDPVLHVDMYTGAAWTYELDFSSTVDFTDIGTSRTIEMFGRTFTIDPNLGVTDRLTLYGSDNTMQLAYGEQKMISINDKDYTIEVVGGTSDGQIARVSVNGVVKSMEEGEIYEFDGGDLEIYAEDIFVTEMPEYQVEVNLFVGSQKIEFPTGNDFNNIRVNGNNVNGIEGKVLSDTNLSEVTSIEVRFTPRDLVSSDRIEYLLEGESLVDPVFGAFEINFVGPNLELTSEQKNFVELQASGRNFELSFVNFHGDELNRQEIFYWDDSKVVWSYENDNRGYAPLGLGGEEIVAETVGDEVTIADANVSEGTGVLTKDAHGYSTGDLVNVTAHAGSLETGVYFVIRTSADTFMLSNSSDYTPLNGDPYNNGELKYNPITKANYFGLERNRVFALNQGQTKVRTKLFEVVSIGKDSSDQNIVTIRDLATGTDTEYRKDGTISGATITGINSDATTRYFNLSVTKSSVVDEFYLEGGENYISLSHNGTGLVHYTEVDTDEATGVTFGFQVKRESGENRLELSAFDLSYIADDNNNRAYGLTTYGTFVEYDYDNDRFAKIWTPKDSTQELAFNAFVNPVGAAIGVGGAGSWNYEPINIPESAFVTDVEVTNPKSRNLIIVGGPCANTVALEVMGADPNNCAAGFTRGSAKIKLYGEDDGMDSGKVALLIAGFSADDTRRAARVMANVEDYPFLEGKSEVEVTGTTMDDIEVGYPVEEEDEEDEPEDDEDETGDDEEGTPEE